ncbi:MAG: hypothetical protein KatS3mg115_1365 [Candidatus Poribacteria bacterium]|nr:MAG: hypothetical protein KatS3mg115_1365 [Candidatus Poribacteria bacterium]
MLWDGKEWVEFSAPRLATRHTHGTGCTYSAAIATLLARGKPLREAIQEAKEYLTGAIRHAPGIGSGHGPLHHFWRFDREVWGP